MVWCGVVWFGVSAHRRLVLASRLLQPLFQCPDLTLERLLLLLVHIFQAGCLSDPLFVHPYYLL